MSFTRSKYDNFHQEDDMRITSYAARYQLEKPEHNCQVGFPAEPSIRLQYSGASWPEQTWRTDVESDLKNINRLGTRVKCNTLSYNPDRNEMNAKHIVNAPDLTLGVTYNRLYNPPCTLRATGWNRWIDLPHDPQLTYETPFDFFVPSRTQSKDAWSKQACLKNAKATIHQGQ